MPTAKEELMKRSFKAATVFAGVGAMTGVFAPAAMAAPAHPAAGAQPDIGNWQECGANNGGVSKWVHIFYPNDDHPAECIEGAGDKAENATIYSFCAGYNVGEVWFEKSGVTSPFAFTQGTTRRHVSAIDGWRGDANIVGLTIHDWSGPNKCT
jgi:hypothetical protein